MRLAVFIKRTTFHSGYGGMETQNKLLCESLAKKGYEIVVFSPKRELKEEESTQNNVKYIFVPCEYRTLFSKLFKNSWYNKSLTYFSDSHQQKNFDLIISQSSAGVSVLQKKEVFDIKGISIAHGTIISELQTSRTNLKGIKSSLRIIRDTIFSLYVFFGRQRDFVHSSDKIAAVSNYVKDALSTETFASEEKFDVIHNGVDVSKFKPNYSDAKDQDYEVGLLFVGRLEREKGCDLLIEMVNDPRFKGIKLDIYGSGSMYDKLKSFESQSIKGCVPIVHGNVPYEEVLSAYLPNKIFLFPTRRIEGFPMVLVEAMLGGCAVVAYNLGGVYDAVKNEKTGYLVDPGDVSEFLDKTLFLLKNKNEREVYGRNAKIVAQKEFSLTKMIDSYVKLITKVSEI